MAAGTHTLSYCQAERLKYLLRTATSTVVTYVLGEDPSLCSR